MIFFPASLATAISTLQLLNFFRSSATYNSRASNFTTPTRTIARSFSCTRRCWRSRWRRWSRGGYGSWRRNSRGRRHSCWLSLQWHFFGHNIIFDLWLLFYELCFRLDTSVW